MGNKVMYLKKYILFIFVYSQKWIMEVQYEFIYCNYNESFKIFL